MYINTVFTIKLYVHVCVPVLGPPYLHLLSQLRPGLVHFMFTVIERERGGGGRK